MEKIILIADENSPVREQVTALVKSRTPYELVIFEFDNDLQNALKKTDATVVVFDCQVMDKYEVALMKLISQIKSDVRFIVLADQITIFSYRQIDFIKNSVTMQKPLQPYLFLSLLEKAVVDEPFHSTRSTRFYIDESVRVLAEKSGLMIPTRMRNYSAGGAFLEYHGISLNVGDKLHLRFKERMALKAKVVWIQDGVHARSPTRGVGVQFLDENF